MKAIVCKEFGPPSALSYEEVEIGNPSKNQILVDIYAAGVNFPDTLIIKNEYQFKPPLPFTPGGELAGIVSAVGEGVTAYKVGDEVIGMPGNGGFAEQILISQSQVFKKPSNMDFATAACFTLTYGTSHYALKDKAQLQPGETVLIMGASGGVGISAIEIAKAMGAKVVAAASSDEKLEVCKEYGADEVINYGKYDLTDREQIKLFRSDIGKATNGNGPNVIYDPVGGNFAEPALRSIAWSGRYLVIGFAAGNIPSIPLNLYLVKGCSAVGVFWGAFTMREPQNHLANMEELSKWHEKGKIKAPVTQTFPLEKAADALDTILARKATGKIALITSFYKK
tara:strand:- start:2734 stop:3750 length:1017 start_codon:yes stop_codon:yes gene_type:complete